MKVGTQLLTDKKNNENLISLPYQTKYSMKLLHDNKSTTTNTLGKILGITKDKTR